MITKTQWQKNFGITHVPTSRVTILLSIVQIIFEIEGIPIQALHAWIFCLISYSLAFYSLKSLLLSLVVQLDEVLFFLYTETQEHFFFNIWY